MGHEVYTDCTQERDYLIAADSFITRCEKRQKEIEEQEKNKSALQRWLEFIVDFRPSPRLGSRYEKPRFNIITGRVE